MVRYTSIVLVVVLFLFLSACASKEVIAEEVEDLSVPSDFILIRRTYADQFGFKNYYSNGNVVLDDNGKLVEEMSGSISKVIALSLSATPAESFEYFDDSDIIKPTSIGGASLALQMPYNYTSELCDASVYITTSIADGFKLYSLYQDDTLAEVELHKDETVLRVVVTETTLKIYAKGLEKEIWR